MKTADEMFEELGFKKDIGEEFGIIRYKHIKKDCYIRFYLEGKAYDTNSVVYNDIFPFEIDMNLEKAIIKKCQELGWI